MGAHYASEPDMPIDYGESMRYYRMAAEAGHMEALYNIGTMYLDGEGVSVDYQRGWALIHEAASQGDMGAQFELMRGYADGHNDLPIDEAEAAYWREKYAAQVPDSDD